MENKEILNTDNMDSSIFLEYIKSYGFDENNYNKILELYQTPKKSISQFLSRNNTFLLAPSIKDCNEFNEMNIKGACGYLNKNEIKIPKTLKNDEILLRNKTLSKENKVLYSIPNINEFDCIIGNGISKDLKKIGLFSQDEFIGFCLDFDNKKTKQILEEYKNVFKLLKELDDKYIFEYDSLYRQGKQLCLIKRK